MKLIVAENGSVSVEIDSNAETFCENQAIKMRKHLTTLFPNDPTIQTIAKYKLWNIGKIAVWYWLRKLEKEKLLRIVRTPFKDDYKVHEDIDDMVVLLMRNGKTYHIEARTRASDIPPTPEQTCRMDLIKPRVVYVFAVYDPRKYVVNMVGFANWTVLQKAASEIELCSAEQEEGEIHIPGEFSIPIRNMGSIEQGVQWMKGTQNVTE